MFDIFCEYGQDFQFDPNGDLLTVEGFDAARQEIQRYLLTNQALTLSNGQKTAADCKFDPDFGAGLRRYLGKLENQVVLNLMRAACLAAVKQSPNVSTSIGPVVAFQVVAPHALLILIDIWSNNNWSTVDILVAP